MMPNLWCLSTAGASCDHTDGYKHIIDPNPSKWYCVLGHKSLCLPALCRCNTVRVRLPSLALCEHTTAPLPAPSFGALQTRHCAEIMCFGGACHRRYLAERGIKSKCVPYDGTCENGASLLGPARNFPKCYHAMLPKANRMHTGMLQQTTGQLLLQPRSTCRVAPPCNSHRTTPAYVAPTRGNAAR